ncbi:ribonuclease P protein component [Desmospora sp. 8437]|nr:ribonuclease P protein component [Desmospora sp. 8437]
MTQNLRQVRRTDFATSPRLGGKLGQADLIPFFHLFTSGAAFPSIIPQWQTGKEGRWIIRYNGGGKRLRFIYISIHPRKKRSK